MADYIEREAAIVSVKKHWGNDDAVTVSIVCIPAADVAPVRHGKWIWDEDGMDWNIGAWRCSECKSMSPMWWNTDKTSPMNKSGHYYCPNCGAKMDADEKKQTIIGAEE